MGARCFDDYMRCVRSRNRKFALTLTPSGARVSGASHAIVKKSENLLLNNVLEYIYLKLKLYICKILFELKLETGWDPAIEQLLILLKEERNKRREVET